MNDPGTDAERPGMTVETTVIHGDCLEVMPTLDAESVDAIVTDPPYGLEFMGKEWDQQRSHIGNPEMTAHREAPPAPGVFGGVSYGAPQRNPWCRRCGKYRRAPAGSKCHCREPDWNTRQDEGGRQMQGWHHRWAVEALRVAKPGAHLLAFGGTRTYHRLACAIEDAAAILAALPADWCGHEAEIARLRGDSHV